MENFEFVSRWTVKYGKYKGKSFRDIVLADPNYAKWLSDIDKSEKVRAYLKDALGC